MVDHDDARSYANDYLRLTELLDKLDAVRALDSPGHREAGYLAQALLDIASEGGRWSSLVSRLAEGDSDSDELANTLHELGESLRHVIYHLGSSRYFSYLRGSTE